MQTDSINNIYIDGYDGIIQDVTLGNKAPRLQGMKSGGPLKCLLVKLDCTINICSPIIETVVLQLYLLHYCW